MSARARLEYLTPIVDAQGGALLKHKEGLFRLPRLLSGRLRRGARHDVARLGGREGGGEVRRKFAVLLDDDLTVHGRVGLEEELVALARHRDCVCAEGADGITGQDRAVALKIKLVDEAVPGHVPDGAVGNAQHEALGVLSKPEVRIVARERHFAHAVVRGERASRPEGIGIGQIQLDRAVNGRAGSLLIEIEVDVSRDLDRLLAAAVDVDDCVASGENRVRSGDGDVSVDLHLTPGHGRDADLVLALHAVDAEVLIGCSDDGRVL